MKTYIHRPEFLQTILPLPSDFQRCWNLCTSFCWKNENVSLYDDECLKWYWQFVKCSVWLNFLAPWITPETLRFSVMRDPAVHDIGPCSKISFTKCNPQNHKFSKCSYFFERCTFSNNLCHHQACYMNVIAKKVYVMTLLHPWTLNHKAFLSVSCINFRFQTDISIQILVLIFLFSMANITKHRDSHCQRNEDA